MPSRPAACMRAAARGVGLDDARDVPVLGLLGERAMRRLADRRGREHRQPVAVVPVGAPAEMGDLDHHRASVLVAVVGEPPEPGHDLVPIGVQVAEGGRAVLGDDRRARGHGQRDAALGLLDVVEPVAVLGQAVLGIGRLVRRAHDPVPQRQMLELERLEQGIRAGHDGEALPSDDPASQDLPALRSAPTAAQRCRRRRPLNRLLPPTIGSPGRGVQPGAPAAAQPAPGGAS